MTRIYAQSQPQKHKVNNNIVDVDYNIVDVNLEHFSEAYRQPCQTYMTELFSKIVN